MVKKGSLFGLALAVMVGMLGCLINGCEERPRPVTVNATLPAELQAGADAFHANCARCHGEQAKGTKQGPPLVHKIYEPSHHGDAAFYRAVANGVRAHHWNFGDMPAIEGVSKDDLSEIVPYVRWLQRQAGIL